MLYANVKSQQINLMPQTKEVKMENFYIYIHIPAERTIVRDIKVTPQPIPIIIKNKSINH